MTMLRPVLWTVAATWAVALVCLVTLRIGGADLPGTVGWLALAGTWVGALGVATVTPAALVPLAWDRWSVRRGRWATRG